MDVKTLYINTPKNESFAAVKRQHATIQKNPVVTKVITIL